VLDEPTNDLDIETLELLEQLLQEYEGTIFLVSHDRAFLDNVVTQTYAFEGEGRWKEYAGGWTDYERARRNSAAIAKAAEAGRELSLADCPLPLPSPSARKRVKLSFNEVRELDALPAKLEALEKEQSELAAKLADPATYTSGTAEPRKLSERHEAIDAELTRLLARWEELEKKK